MQHTAKRSCTIRHRLQQQTRLRAIVARCTQHDCHAAVQRLQLRLTICATLFLDHELQRALGYLAFHGTAVAVFDCGNNSGTFHAPGLKE